MFGRLRFVVFGQLLCLSLFAIDGQHDSTRITGEVVLAVSGTAIGGSRVDQEPGKNSELLIQEMVATYGVSRKEAIELLVIDDANFQVPATPTAVDDGRDAGGRLGGLLDPNKPKETVVEGDETPSVLEDGALPDKVDRGVGAIFRGFDLGDNAKGTGPQESGAPVETGQSQGGALAGIFSGMGAARGGSGTETKSQTPSPIAGRQPDTNSGGRRSPARNPTTTDDQAWNRLNSLEKTLAANPSTDSAARGRVQEVIDRVRRRVIDQSATGKKMETRLGNQLSQMKAHRKTNSSLDTGDTVSSPPSAVVGNAGSGAGLQDPALFQAGGLGTRSLDGLADPQLAREVRAALVEDPNGEVAQILAQLGIVPWPEGMPGQAEFLPGVFKERPNVAEGLGSEATTGSGGGADAGAGPSDFDWWRTSMGRAARDFLAAWRKAKGAGAGKTDGKGAGAIEGVDPIEALLAAKNRDAQQLDQIFAGRRQPSSLGRDAVLGPLNREDALPLAYLAVLVLAAAATGLWVAWVLGAFGIGFLPSRAKWRLLEWLPWLLWRRKKKNAPSAVESSTVSSP